MIQQHTIVLWKKPCSPNATFEEICKETFNFLSLFQNYPVIFRPNYFTGRTKKDKNIFTWEYSDFEKELKRKVNHEGNNAFENLGYTFSMFSSLDFDKSSSFQITVGNKDDRFMNTFVMKFPVEIDMYDQTNSNYAQSIFKDLVKNFKPFWGCISNKAFPINFNNFLKNKKPTTIHWMNYWNNEIESVIGMKQIKNAINTYPSITYKDGFFSLGSIALDITKQSDVSLHDNVEKILRLNL